MSAPPGPRLLSVAVGAPQPVRWRGRLIRTSIFKSVVPGRVGVGLINLEGDDQADRTVHGGRDKAVYVYPSEHYPTWQEELSLVSLPSPAFGENLTTVGLHESMVGIGDRYRIGSAEFVVTQPRQPCFKLGIKFGRNDIVARFASVDRSGFYLAIEQQGEIGAGDAIVLLSRHPVRLTVAEAYRLKFRSGPPDRLALAASHPGLPVGWREAFREALENIE